ncbi:MAG TPA: BON domain-containing protein [Chloroflexota bacterium]|nr:BON domain-containing protein [Chloroflexota bacterium]
MIPTTRSDDAIANDVRETLTWDTRVDATEIRVGVHDGIVYLSGNVRLLAERNLAADDAWRVKGVRQVIDQLAVSPVAARSDQEIATDVVTTLRYDKRVDLNGVAVQVAGGVVTLAGAVGTPLERRAAEEDAWYTPGVVAVVDQLEVTPTKTVSDAQILTDVRAAIDRDARILDATRVSVTVNAGEVTVRGHVESPEERQAIQEDACFTAGVRAITNDLSVNGVA